MEGSIVNWTVFIGVSAIVVVGIYYIFKNSAIGNLFSDIFSVLDRGVAAMNEQLEKCQDAGFFSTSCGIGIFFIVAGIGYLFFVVGRFMLGTPTETRAGQLWESIKGRRVTVEDMKDIKATVETLQKEWELDPKNSQKIQDIKKFEGGQEFFERSIAIHETHRRTVQDLDPNNPTDQSKRALADKVRDEQLSRQKRIFEYGEDDNDPSPEKTQNAEDIENYAKDIFV